MSNKSSKKIISRLIALSIAVVAVIAKLYRTNDTFRNTVNDKRTQFGDEIIEVEKRVPLFKNSPKLRRVADTLRDYIIPHEGNNHHPKALRPKALTSYVVVIALMKVLVTGTLFFVYPNNGLVSSKISDDIFVLTNQTRAEAGLAPLTRNTALDAAAQKKVEDMIADGYFAHISPDGTKPWQFIDAKQYDFTHMGENLAMDFSSARVAHSAFLNSPTHKANIVHDDYTDVGIAVLVGELFGRDTIVLAEFFGKQRVSPTLAVASIENTEAIAPATPVNSPEQVNTPEQNIQEQPEPTVPNPPTQPDLPEEPVSQPTTVESFEVEEVGSEETIPETETPALPEVIENTDADTDTTANDISEPESVAQVSESETKPVSAPNNVTESNTESIESTITESKDQENGIPISVASIDDDSTFQSGPALVVVDEPLLEKGLVDLLVSWTRNFMTLMLVVLTLLLIVNIGVRAHIQHAHVIVHSVLAIIFIVTMLYTHIHVLERFVVY